MATYRTTVNMEYVRSAGEDFRAGIAIVAELDGSARVRAHAVRARQGHQPRPAEAEHGKETGAPMRCAPTIVGSRLHNGRRS